MTITTLSSRQFNQDAGGAKKAAERGPVFITDRGRLTNVLLNIEEYRRLTGSHRNIVDLLAMPGIEDIELTIPPRRDVPRSANLGE